MILLDYSAISIAAIMVAVKMEREILNERLVLHMAINSIRAYNAKYRTKYGEMIICCDHENNWRKKDFPHYKMNRKKSKENDNIDWDIIYEGVELVKDHINTSFPFKVIECTGAEADDIIGVLANKATRQQEKSIIISNDHDFFQLHSEYVEQWKPASKSKVCYTGVDDILKEHIMRGDNGDGIPNVLSDEDTFVNPIKRQSPMTSKRINNLMSMSYEDIKSDDVLKGRYNMNKKLIDLSNTPHYIKEDVNVKYENALTSNKLKMIQFFVEKGLRYHHEHINDFF